MIEKERLAEADRLTQHISSQKGFDLEGIEFYVRASMLAAGARVIEQFVNNLAVGRQSEPRMCANKHPPAAMASAGVRAKVVRTLLGPVRFRRSRLCCPVCHKSACPGDELLGVVGTRRSPGARRLLAKAGSCAEGYVAAADDLFLFAGLRFSPKTVERETKITGRQIDAWMRKEASAAVLRDACGQTTRARSEQQYIELDGTAAPMRRSELVGVRGKGPGGKAKSREVKLGCVFTQSGVDAEGRPVRDAFSTSYIAAIENSSTFGLRLYQEAVRCELNHFTAQPVVISDGAEYNATIVQEQFPGSLHIIDIYHAYEHLADFVKNFTKHEADGQFHEQCRELLREGRIEQLVENMKQHQPARGQRRKESEKSIAYFTARAEKMRYAEYRARGLFIGSGVVEAGCKTVVGNRLKRSGMLWSVAGVNAIVATRCCIQSGRYEQFWEDAGL